MRATVKENLMITMGMYAGSLMEKGVIEIPEGNEGEDILADFIAESVSAYQETRKIDDLPFCAFAEDALMVRFNPDHSGLIKVKIPDDEFEVYCKPSEGECAGVAIFRGTYRECCNVWHDNLTRYEQWHVYIRRVRK